MREHGLAEGESRLDIETAWSSEYLEVILGDQHVCPPPVPACMDGERRAG